MTIHTETLDTIRRNAITLSGNDGDYDALVERAR